MKGYQPEKKGNEDFNNTPPKDGSAYGENYNMDSASKITIGQLNKCAIELGCTLEMRIVQDNGEGIEITQVSKALAENDKANKILQNKYKKFLIFEALKCRTSPIKKGEECLSLVACGGPGFEKCFICLERQLKKYKIDPERFDEKGRIIENKI